MIKVNGKDFCRFPHAKIATTRPGHIAVKKRDLDSAY
jgi:hypothetical protein